MADPADRYSKIALDSKGKLRDAWNKFAKKFQVVESYQSQIEQSDRSIQRAELDMLLRTHVCEVVFVRRRPERAPDRPSIRRMICTNSQYLLNSDNGVKSLNYHPPRTSRRLDEVKHNIVVVWDIFMQDYRNVSMDTCYLRQTIPDDDTFWNYYNDALYRMTPIQKLNFMDSVA
jgi:hypothetical protein